MNEGMYIGLRSYLEEHSSLLRQLLDEQKRTNEMLSQLVQPSGEPIRDIDPGIMYDPNKPKVAAKKGK